MPSVKVNVKHQITLPSAVIKKLNIQKGDSLLMDVQNGMVVLTPKPKRYTDYLQGLHGDIWKGVDTQKHLNGEHKAWKNSAEE